MNIIDREITQYEGETFSSHDDSIKWLKESYQRVIDETKKKCIEALPKKKSYKVNMMGTCSLCGSMEADSGCVCDGFNLAIQQSKQNIGRMR